MQLQAPSMPYTMHQYTYPESHDGAHTREIHSHDFYQMIYAQSGVGYVRINDVDYMLSAGQAILISPGSLHGIGGSDLCMHTYEFKFGIGDYYKKFSGILENRVLECDREIAEFITKTAFEARNSIYAKEIIALNLAQVIVMFAEKENAGNVLVENSIDSKKSQSFLAYSIKNYIDEYFAKNVTTKEIAKSFFLSESHMRRVFTKAYGVSPIKYRNKLRIESAKKLIETTSYSITEISGLVGFESLHYFSRYFNASEKMTPSEYKETVKSNFVASFK